MNGKLKIYSVLLLMLLLATDICAQEGSGVYVGGHIRRERPNTITKLKNSGFTYVILFNVNVETDGTLTTDGETICKAGEYVFDQQQPHYVEDVKALKTWPTGIERIEICIGGWGNESYMRIRDLINRYGTNENTILYKNFKALKDMLPEIDAVNNDDEHCYDVNSAVKFHAMMSTMGYKTTVAPYMNKSFWKSLVEQLNKVHPGACDRVLVQCYDGGAYNDPIDWKIGDVPIHAGRTNYQTDMQTSINQMQVWHDQKDVVGGFVWVYNDETWNLNQWASAMNRIFSAKKADNPVVTFYNANNFGGYSVQLAEGEYCTGELSAYGLTDKDIASFKMLPGYKLTGYISNDLTGLNKEWTDEEMARMGAWGKRISSLKIERLQDDTGIANIGITETTIINYYDLQGRKLKEKPNKGFYLMERNGSVKVVGN